MDIEHFLKKRTEFILYFFKNAIEPFNEIIHAIENEIEPYIPPYSEDGEPPFLAEWMDAETGINTVANTALSMLSSSLQLFLNEWVNRLKRNHGMVFDVSWRKGWFNGYKSIFEIVGLDLKTCPANLDIIEQIVLARNRIQHPESIANLSVNHSANDLKKYPRPFFIQEHELKQLTENKDKDFSWWFTPQIRYDIEKINEAIIQVEALCTWLDAEYWEARATKNAVKNKSRV